MSTQLMEQSEHKLLCELTPTPISKHTKRCLLKLVWG